MEESSAGDGSFVLHLEPVWRGRANFIINAELEAMDLPRRFEQLWVRQIDADRFELCCIPFFLFGVALGDVVETVSKGGHRYVLHRVVEPSGRYVFRVWFGESFHPREEIAGELASLGALLEWSSVNLLAVDAVDATHAQTVADFLHDSEQRGHLIYETGRSVQP